MDFKVNKWVIDKQFDFCFGHRVWSQELNTKYSLDGCLACRHLHGHQGKVKLFLGANNLNKGMVTDFKHTNIFKKWLDDVMDHKFVIDVNDPLFNNLVEFYKPGKTIKELNNVYIDNEYNYATPYLQFINNELDKRDYPEDVRQAIYEKYEGLVFVDFIPTSERLCQWWYEVANKMLNGLGINVVAVEYWETPKSHCRYQPE